MMNFTKTALLGLGILLLVSPVSSYAFTAYDQAAIKLTDTTMLYTLKYRLGYGSSALSAPLFVSAKPSAHKHDGNVAGVSFAGPRVVESMRGIVLSDASVKDGEYYVAPEEEQLFTMFVIARVAEGATVPKQMQVESLPFTIVSGSTEIPNGLSAGELSSYVVEGEIE